MRYDMRTVAQLCSDTGAPVIDPTTDPNLAAILLDASGTVEMATMVGARYGPADLAALTGAGAAFLKRLVCDIAIGMLYQRRPHLGEPPAQYTLAMEVLDKLSEGTAVFGLLESQEAGILSDLVEKSADVEYRYLSSVIARRWVGVRGKELNG
jgi:hypothetical protein